MISEKVADGIDIPESAVGDFSGINDWAKISARAVHPDKFPTGLWAGVDFEMFAQLALRDFQAEFLAQFAHCTVIVALSAAEVTRRAGVVAVRERVLARSALLKKDLTRRIEDKNVNRAMLQSAGVYFTARSTADHAVVIVHHIKELVID